MIETLTVPAVLLPAFVMIAVLATFGWVPMAVTTNLTIIFMS